MRRRSTSIRLTLPLLLLLLAGLACNFGSGAQGISVDEAVRLTLAVKEPAGTAPPAVIAVAATTAPPTEPAPTATFTTAPPTPTVVHMTIPGSPGGVNSFMTDRSSAALAAERRSIGDNFDINLFERPFTATTMDYQGYLDINRAELSAASPWLYVTLFLEQAPPAGTAAWYAAEVDTDLDGRGDYLVVGQGPSRTDWTADGVQVFYDSNNDVGGANPIAADPPPQTGNGYDQKIFDQGQGTDPDMAWIRISPSNPTRVQLAFKYAAVGAPDKFLWGAIADEGVKHPDWLDYNDHFTPADAGSPTSGSSLYPVKALASIDNTCRWAYGFVPTGTEPGICPVPPTPTPKPDGSIAGVAYADYSHIGTRDPGEPGIGNLTVTLGAGACPSSGLASTTTAGNGSYFFGGLSAGTYCVRVHPVNCSWIAVTTDPITVNLNAGENKNGINVGMQQAPC